MALAAQRYTNETALVNMSRGACPECGEYPETHVADTRWWIPRQCDLRPIGVADRIRQYNEDKEKNETDNRV